jgi:hypothetical protein
MQIIILKSNVINSRNFVPIILHALLTDLMLSGKEISSHPCHYLQTLTTGIQLAVGIIFAPWRASKFREKTVIGQIDTYKQTVSEMDKEI